MVLLLLSVIVCRIDQNRKVKYVLEVSMKLNVNECVRAAQRERNRKSHCEKKKKKKFSKKKEVTFLDEKGLPNALIIL